MIRTVTLGAAAGLLLAGGAFAQPYGYDRHAGGYERPGYSGYTTPGAMPGQEFVLRAGQSDQFEIRSSRLALSRARDPRVRQFADQMIRDHSYTTDRMMDAVRRSRVPTPGGPPPLGPDKRAMLDQLQSARGYDFDRLYADQQLRAHQEALSLMQSYAGTGEDWALRQVAQEAVPIIRHHLQMARDLQRGGY